MMNLSELQIALIAIGVIILLGIVAYNLLKSRRKAASLNSGRASAQDLGTSPQFQEPTFRMGDSLASEPLKFEPNFNVSSVQQDSISIEQPPQSLSLSPRIDPAIDSVVFLRFSVPISGAEILSQLSAWPKNTPYRYLIEGLGSKSSDSDSSETLEWSSIQADDFYRELQLAVQLANRRGPIGVVDLSEFLSRSQALADSLDAEIDLPPVNEVVDQAKLIDQFCLTADIQLGFQLMANMISWDAKDVASALQNRGLILSRDGGYFHCYQNDQLLFRVQAEEVNFLRDDLQDRRIKHVQFLLDVPLAPSQINPFVAMLNKANELAADLDGRLLDDNGQALSQAAIEMIKNHLDGIYEMMKSRDVIPGSISAQRLFS